MADQEGVGLWVYEQVILNNRKRLRDLLPDLFTSIETGKRITDLPTDVLALCLSHVAISDIRSCWLTCKAFAKAITTRQHFWKRHVQAHLMHVATALFPTHIGFEALKVIPLFDTFASPKPETLREQVQFLFMKDKRNFVDMYFSVKREYINIDRQSGSGKVLSFAIKHAAMKVLSIGIYESAVGIFDCKKGEYFEKCQNDDGSGHHLLIWQKGVAQFSQDLPLKSINARWTGAVYDKDDSPVVAHGKGKWTFADGTVLEGEHVAEYGKPVFRLSYEEMQEYKRLKGEQK
jgi:hypothetical protein